jgi:hypothetical protein
MAKKVTIQPKPTKTAAPSLTGDEWVARGRTPTEAAQGEPSKDAPTKIEKIKTTRYTIDIPTTLHQQIKSKCAAKGLKMNEEVIRLLRKAFGD